MTAFQPRSVLPNDFEDISLTDLTEFKSQQTKRKSQNSEFRLSNASFYRDNHTLTEDEGDNSIPSLSTPTLISDSSSVRSSSNSSSPKTPTSTINRKSSPLSSISVPDLGSTHREIVGGKGNNLSRKKSINVYDTTSMASLTIRSKEATRTRKQREQEFDQDKDDNVWPHDGFMFNVPMSPALFTQQRKQSKMNQAGPSRSKLNQHSHPGSSHSQGQSQGQPQDRSIKYPPSRREKLSQHNLGYNTTQNMSTPSLPHPSQTLQLAHNINHDHFNGPILPGLDPETSELTRKFSKLNESESNLSLHLDQDDDTDIQIPPAIPSSSSGPDSRRSSLTRPENLPPKSEEEERKHLKSYEKILLEGKAVEKKKQQKKEAEAKKKQQQMKRDKIVWEDWLDKQCKPKLARELRWRGIPEQVRGQVWRTIVHADDITLPSKIQPVYTDEIIKDSEHIWPECCIFAPNRPLHDDLMRSVQTFYTARPELPYHSSITQLMALLLLYLDYPDGAKVLIQLVKPKSLIYEVHNGNEKLAMANYVPFYKFFGAKFEQLSKHFAKIGIDQCELLNPFMKGLFSNILSTPECAARIIDVYLFEGESFLLRAALGIIRINEAWLYGSKPEVLAQLSHSRELEEDKLMSITYEVTKQ